MRPLNLWKYVRGALTPPRGRSERMSFSLGQRPLHGETPSPGGGPPQEEGGSGHALSKSLSDNERLLKKVFHVPTSSDVVFRDIRCASPTVRVSVSYVEGMASFEKVFSSVLQPIMLLSAMRKEAGEPVKHLKEALLVNGQVEEKKTIEDLVEAMVMGDTVVLIDGTDRALVVETKGWEHRPVGETVTERIVRGPQQGFVEVLRLNTAIVRSIVQTPDLVVENVDLGLSAKNRCALLYVHGLANPKVVAEVRRRLHGISTSEIMTSGTLEQYIETSHSILPTIMSTERPDRVAHFLMAGACAVIVAGDPFALVMPVTLFTFVHSPEDNYVRWPYGNMLRAIRYLGLFLVVFLPGLYVAVVNYNPEMIPTSLIMAIAASREPIPFPLSVEVMIMFVGFELIREAGIRIPSPIGPTIGIVGALLIGEAAVAASIVSPILVIVVAVTAVASFTTPNQELAMFTRLATLIFILAGATLGLFGIVALTYVMLCHAASLTSVGVPFLSPLSPIRSDQQYGPSATPPWKARKRPEELRPQDTTRQPETSRLWDQGKTLGDAMQERGESESSDLQDVGRKGGGKGADRLGAEQGPAQGRRREGR